MFWNFLILLKIMRKLCFSKKQMNCVYFFIVLNDVGYLDTVESQINKSILPT